MAAWQENPIVWAVVLFVAYKLLRALFGKKVEASWQAGGTGENDDPIDPELRARHSLAPGVVPTWTSAQVAAHDKQSDLWMIVDGKVYDVTDFVLEHPGGEEALLKDGIPGRDATKEFHGPHHPDRAHATLPDYYIGNHKESKKTK
jgi:hypothetical protein